METLKLYRFYRDCGRMGEVEGLFVCNEQDVKNAIGKNVYFGEILGKHSEIQGVLEDKDFTVISDDQEFIVKYCNVFYKRTISGYNPLFLT